MGTFVRVVIADLLVGPAAGAVLVGYLLGSIPFAVVIGRRRGVDVRNGGDGNPGYWNAKEQLGRRSAVPVLIGDAAKGALAAGFGELVGGDRWWIAYLAVGAAMIGHAFPLFARFRGGRSVLTFVGGVFVLSPLAAAGAVLVMLCVSAASRRFPWGVRAGVFGYPLLQAVVDPRARVAATGCLMAIIGARFAMAARADQAPRGVPEVDA